MPTTTTQLETMMDDQSIDADQKEACEAYLSATGASDLSNFEEAYQGLFHSDEDFVQELLEQTGVIPKDFPSYISIDWERTARDIMMDYCEESGFYFRNL